MTRAHNRTRDVIRHHWDRRAATFDEEAGHGLTHPDQRAAWLELLRGITSTERLDALDVGCGTGFLAGLLAELGHRVTGVDLSPGMIEQARKKAAAQGLEIDFRVSDAAALGLASASYDLVVARHVIWNLPEPDRGVQEWLRVLRPGGRLALVEGKWADNEELERSLASPVGRVSERALDAAGAVADRLGGRVGRLPATKLRNVKYRRLEARLPFSGGPPADTLREFLAEHGLVDLAVDPLMDPRLWGEEPAFPRYVVVGRRPAG
jgi:SAM-dependent methyltransferase